VTPELRIGPELPFLPRFTIVDGTVPPPEPVGTLAAQLEVPERLDAAFQAVDQLLEWLRRTSEGDIPL